MAITKGKKKELYDKYTDNIERSSAIFVTKYQGIPVNKLSSLRRKLQEADARYMVVKNTIAQKVLKEQGLTEIDDLLQDSVGLVFSYSDPPSVAKALLDYVKEEERLEIEGGLIGRSRFDKNDVSNISKLPSLDVTRAQLLGIISGPASTLARLLSTPPTQLVGVINSGVRQVVNVIQAYSKSDED